MRMPTNHTCTNCGKELTDQYVREDEYYCFECFGV